GSRIRVQGKGEARGSTKGALYLRVKVKPHPIFTRKGDDIYLEVPVTVYEAALGNKIEVPTIDGTAEMTIPPGVQSGSKLRLKGKGATNLKTKVRGDQYIEIKIAMPDKITDEDRKKFEEIGKSHPYNPRVKFARYMR
ncbi:MAG: molecular chaperone DnaJ, partial [Candidatus Dadabacteria bacterium]